MGGSSSQTIGQRYFAKLAVFIGNPIENLIGINFDNRGWIYKPDGDESSFRIEKQNLYGDKEGGVAGFVDIHTGTADQLPNAFYKADFPKVSGYPYQSYLVFRGLGQRVSGGIIGGIAGIIMGGQHYSASFYLGNSGYMKEMLLWPKRTRIRNDGRRQWYEVREDGAIVCEIDALQIQDLSSQIFPYLLNESISWSIGIESGVDSGIVDIYAIENNKYYSTSIVEPLGIGDPYGSSATFNYECSASVDVGTHVVFWIQKTEQNYTLSMSGLKVLKTREIEYNFYEFTEYICSFRPSFSLSISVSGYEVNGLKTIYYTRFFNPFLEGNNPITGFDINPIHKIREILTDDTAMNKPEISVNDENFMKAADRVYDEGLGVSWSITEKSCLDAINELCGHIEAGVRINRQTGLYEMVLFRDNWFEEDEIHVLLQNKIKSLQLDVQNADESINQLNVSYYNRDAIKNSSFSIAENASIKNLQGRVNAETADFPYFMNQRNAAVVAQWKLKQMSTPVWQGTFTTGFYEARKWNRYDLLKLAWPRKWQGTILVRIMKINLGTGTDVSIDFVEVVPYSSDLSSNIVIDTPVDTSPKPPQPALFKTFELSYFEAVQLNGQKAVDDALAYNPDAGYVSVIAKKPQSNSLSALMYTDIGNDYERAGTIAYCETAELDQTISQTNTAFIVKNAGSLGAVNVGTQITIDNEIMVYQSYDAETSLLTVKRGALDTIPQNHNAGSVLYFADDFITVDSTEYVTSEVIDVKVLTTTPSGILDIEDVDAQQVEIQARAIRPYLPANVKFNGAYFPETQIITNDIVLTWAHRNRLQQTGGEILGWYEGDVTAEEGVTYSYELTSNNTVLASASNITSNTTMINASILILNKAHTLKLWSIRDGYKSYQVFEHSFFVEAISLILTATASKDKAVGSTVPAANISVVVDETLKANIRFDGSGIQGKTQAGATITIEVSE